MSNSVVNSGGPPSPGIDNYRPLTITNSTIANHGGPYGGFGIVNNSVMTLTNVTLSDNLGNLATTSIGSSYLRNTILADFNSGQNNCGSDGPVISLGHNLSSDGSCALNASGDLTNTNPLLGPLQDNGGPTPTNALLPGSPAINHGDTSGCPATDQRGIARPQAGVCDIGAYEYVFPDVMFLPFVNR